MGLHRADWPPARHHEDSLILVRHGYLRQRFNDPLGHRYVGLSTGRGSELASVPLAESTCVARVDLMPRKSFPLAEVDFAKSRILLHFESESS